MPISSRLWPRSAIAPRSGAGAVEDQAGGQMRNHPVAVGRELLAERERGLDALRGGGGDCDGELSRDVPDHVLLDTAEPNHLEARTPEEVNKDVCVAGQCSVASRCFGISFFGSMKGICTTTASRRAPSTSISSSVRSWASSIGTIA